MTDDLRLAYHRWQAAEAAGEDETADAAFGEVYGASMPAALPSPGFVTRTMAAVAVAAEAEARRARRVRAGLLWIGAPGAAAALYLAAAPLASLLSTALGASVDLLVSLVVLFADGSGTRRTAWSVLTGLGRAMAAFAADPRVTFAMLVCQATAVAALVVLHRLLGSGREWLR